MMGDLPIRFFQKTGQIGYHLFVRFLKTLICNLLLKMWMLLMRLFLQHYQEPWTS